MKARKVVREHVGGLRVDRGGCEWRRSVPNRGNCSSEHLLDLQKCAKQYSRDVYRAGLLVLLIVAVVLFQLLCSRLRR